MLTVDEKREALERVLQSDTFARADQLKSFLRYVCEMELNGKADQISEYLIGVHALGKQEGFSTSEDTSVRNRAYALRQKLEQYYAEDQGVSRVRIEFRKGTYVPRFVEVDPVPVDTPHEGAFRASAVRSRWPMLAALSFGTLLGAAAVALYFSIVYRPPATKPSSDPVVLRAWGPILDPNAQVTLSLSTSAQLTVLPYDVKVEALPEVPTLELPAPLQDWYLRLQRTTSMGRLHIVPNDNSPHFGDVLGAIKIIHLIESRQGKVDIFPERLIRTPALADRNMVVFGVPYKSEVARKLLENGAFSFEYDASGRDFVVAERRENQGPARYSMRRDVANMRVETYAVVTVLSRNQRGPKPSRTIVFSGDPSAGAAAAVDYLANPDHLRQLERRFIDQGLSGLPPSFQVLLRCKVDENLPLVASYVSHHRLPD